MKDKEWLKEEVLKLQKEANTRNEYGSNYSDEQLVLKKALSLIDQLEEPEKPVVPQFVAEYIKYAKGRVYSLREAMTSEEMPYEVDKWLLDFPSKEFANQNLFALAWRNGYEVEKKKRYYIINKAYKSTLMTLDLSDTDGEEIIEFVDAYSENETIHFDSKEKAELIARFIGDFVEAEEVTN